MKNVVAWLASNHRRLLLAGSLMGIGILVAIGTALVMNALVVAFVVLLGFIMLFVKLPQAVRSFMVAHHAWSA